MWEVSKSAKLKCTKWTIFHWNLPALHKKTCGKMSSGRIFFYEINQGLAILNSLLNMKLQDMSSDILLTIMIDCCREYIRDNVCTGTMLIKWLKQKCQIFSQVWPVWIQCEPSVDPVCLEYPSVDPVWAQCGSSVLAVPQCEPSVQKIFLSLTSVTQCGSSVTQCHDKITKSAPV